MVFPSVCWPACLGSGFRSGLRLAIGSGKDIYFGRWSQLFVCLFMCFVFSVAFFFYLCCWIVPFPGMRWPACPGSGLRSGLRLAIGSGYLFLPEELAICLFIYVFCFLCCFLFLSLWLNHALPWRVLASTSRVSVRVRAIGSGQDIYVGWWSQLFVCLLFLCFLCCFFCAFLFVMLGNLSGTFTWRIY